LLSDWPDSETEISQADIEILDFAKAQIVRLNQRYPAEGAPRFHLLHRHRLYNPSQGCWMGWERKRGKLHELNLLLRGDSDTTFMPLDAPLPESVVHVMTLDADTRTTRDAVARLVGKLCHPLNRPHHDVADFGRRGVVLPARLFGEPRARPIRVRRVRSLSGSFRCRVLHGQGP